MLVSSRAGDPVVSLEGVTFRRGEAVALEGVDWTVRHGEHWAVLGPNGSGKTTLIMVATGYLPSSSGRTYLIDGYISQIVLPQTRLKVGLVSAALSDRMLTGRAKTTGLEVVLSGRHGSLGLYSRPTGDDLDQAGGIMDRLGIAELRDKSYGLMSTGQRQLCLVGRCYMAHSELIILDEPCAGLDLAVRERLLAAVERACRERPDVPHVLVTHHPEEIVPAVSHVLLLHEGRVVASGRKREVLTERNLEATFGLPLRVVHDGRRIWIIPQAGPAG
jgi:iron complex transport system ATP-binding protein